MRLSGMIRALAAAVALAAFATIPGEARAQVALTDDAHTVNSARDTENNQGSSPNLSASESGSVYLKFKLTSALPQNSAGADVTRATLKLYVGGVQSAGTLNVYEVAGSWSEGSVNANNAPPLGPLVAAGVPVAAELKGKFLVIDVTTAVRRWLGSDGRGTGGVPNHGLALVAGAGARVTFDSKENSQTSHEPQLNIMLNGGVGPAGPQGEPGPQGSQGERGERGEPGQGLSSLEGLEGLTCTRESVGGRVGLVYASNGDVTMRCVAEALPPDELPSLTVSDAATVEDGTLRFGVTLSAPTFRTVRVAYATADGTAASPSDYAATGGVLVFAPGETSKEVFVTTVQDGVAESEEGFALMLSAPTSATLSDPRGDGRISDIAPLPTLSINDTTCQERQPCSVTISLSSPSAQDVTFTFNVEDGTALDGRDYFSPSGRSGRFTIPVGQTSATITFDCLDDGLAADADQYFFVRVELNADASTARVTVRP